MIEMQDHSLLCLDTLGIRADVLCSDAATSQLIIANYSACLAKNAATASPDASYSAALDGTGFRLQRNDAAEVRAWDNLDAAELIFLLEKDLTIEAQIRHPEFYFLHAAAISRNERAVLLIGRSGNGKSTTCWGLLNHACGYLSDELAPIDLRQFLVQPYPHALCLKSEPSAPYSVPQDVLRTPPTLHIPAEHLPCPVVDAPVPLSAIVHIQHTGTDRPSVLSRLGTAEAGMLIYANALNPLCHEEDGLAAAIEIARHCKVYSLTTGTLASGIDRLLEALDG